MTSLPCYFQNSWPNFGHNFGLSVKEQICILESMVLEKLKDGIFNDKNGKNILTTIGLNFVVILGTVYVTFYFILFFKIPTCYLRFIFCHLFSQCNCYGANINWYGLLNETWLWKYFTMGGVIGKAANGIGGVIGSAFAAPIKTIFGASCE